MENKNSRIEDALDIISNICLENQRDPFEICRKLDIDILDHYSLERDGYLVLFRNIKLIFVSSNIQNYHTKKFVVAHELGHFLMHGNTLYSCSCLRDSFGNELNTIDQEQEANSFAMELMLPRESIDELLTKEVISFSLIKRIAQDFDISVTSAAIKIVKNSKSKSEILLCYDNDQLRWYVTTDTSICRWDIPDTFPHDAYKGDISTKAFGIWNSLYDGAVQQELFFPAKGQKLVLLSGERV